MRFSQLTLIMGNQAEEQKTSAFTFSQEIIDAVLTRGSGVSEGKMRIYEQFEKSISAKENADLLKNEYGWGGSYPVIIGAGIDEQHDGKGITISKGIGSDKPHRTLCVLPDDRRKGCSQFRRSQKQLAHRHSSLDILKCLPVYSGYPAGI